MARRTTHAQPTAEPSPQTPAQQRPPTIRLGTPGDVDALVALESRCFPEVDLFPRRSWAHLVGPAARGGRTITLVIDGAPAEPALVGAVVGLMRRGSEAIRVYSLAVDPTQRGRGLAGQLVRALARRARARGKRRMTLEVRTANSAALALYEKFGFVVGDLLPRYYGDGADGFKLSAPLARVLARAPDGSAPRR
jgi:ribosomal protein S18 acetylase RimI-like enzyme